MLTRIVDVLVVVVALRDVGGILAEADAVIEAVLAVGLHLSLGFYDLVGSVPCDLEPVVGLRGLLLAVFAVNDLALLRTTRDVGICVLEVEAYHLRGLNEEVPVLKQRRRVGQLLLVAIIEIVVEVEHLFVGLIKLVLVIRVEVVLRELQLVDLALHFVEVLVHLVRVHVVDLRDVFDTLLKVPLVLH